MEKIIVIVPAYCEEETIAKTVRALKDLHPILGKKDFAFLVYVINDGSTDKTAEKAQLAGADKIVHLRVNQGLGSAVRTGLQVARHDQATILVKFDADLQHDPQDILRIIQPILNDEAEVVYGNRFEKISYKMAFIRKTGNMVFSGLMRRLVKSRNCSFLSSPRRRGSSIINWL
jgi:glycosyltransferase involved in cell wall biosynthesis